MADTLTTNPLIIDLTDATLRQIANAPVKICSMILTGTSGAGGAGSRTNLSDAQTNLIWSWVANTSAQRVNEQFFLDAMTNLGSDNTTPGLWYGATAAAWASGYLFIYFE